MPLSCNIDARGRRYRLLMGIALLLIGLIMLLLWPVRTGGWVAWVVTSCVIVSGAVGVFEARHSWCVLRAMGFKTRI